MELEGTGVWGNLRKLFQTPRKPDFLQESPERRKNKPHRRVTPFNKRDVGRFLLKSRLVSPVWSILGTGEPLGVKVGAIQFQPHFGLIIPFA